MIRLLLILPIIALSLMGQSNLPQFAGFYEQTNPSTGDMFVLQQPTDGTKRAAVLGVDVYCSVACEFYLACNGSAASQTAVTPVDTSLQGNTATLKVWRQANVTGATQCTKKYSVSSGQSYPLDLTGINMLPTGSVQQISVYIVAGFSGTARYQFVWRESR